MKESVVIGVLRYVRAEIIRDGADGHLISMIADDNEPSFSEWCGEMAREGWRVAKL